MMELLLLWRQQHLVSHPSLKYLEPTRMNYTAEPKGNGIKLGLPKRSLISSLKRQFC